MQNKTVIDIWAPLQPTLLQPRRSAEATPQLVEAFNKWLCDARENGWDESNWRAVGKESKWGHLVQFLTDNSWDVLVKADGVMFVKRFEVSKRDLVNNND